MVSATLPVASIQIEEPVASAVRIGLSAQPKRLPAWLFYDQAGSLLFEEITELPEYYLTRTERGILSANAPAMIALASQSNTDEPLRLRISELGAGSADKTRLLLTAAVEQQGAVLYEPIDVSASALEAARKRVVQEIPGVTVAPMLMDYTNGLELNPLGADERRLMLYIGSSIGNFEPDEALRLLRRMRERLNPGDGLLLGVDQVKGESTLLAAYDDTAGVTASFNLNLLARLNREAAANFVPEAFTHRAIWNSTHSRIEMHLVSRAAQRVHLAALDLHVTFEAGESIHTENSYKYMPGQAERILADAGFTPTATWTDERGWFAVCMGQVE